VDIYKSSIIFLATSYKWLCERYIWAMYLYLQHYVPALRGHDEKERKKRHSISQLREGMRCWSLPILNGQFLRSWSTSQV